MITLTDIVPFVIVGTMIYAAVRFIWIENKKR